MYIYTAIIFNISFSFIRIFCKIISLSKNLMGNLNKCKMSHFSNQKLRHLFFCFNFPYNWYPSINNLLVSKLAQSPIYKCRIFILIKEIFDSIRKKKRIIKLPRRQFGSSVMMMRTAHCGACIGSRSLQITDTNGQKYIICRIFKQNNFPLLFYNACNYFLLNLLMRNNCSKERSVNCKNENLVNFKLTAYIQHLRCLELIFFLQICIICWHTCSFGSQQSCLLTNQARCMLIASH